MSEQGELLALIASRLAEAGIPYIVVGSLASSFHGEPRQTRDIDVVIDPDAASLELFVAALPSDAYYLDAGAAREALARRISFNVVEIASGWKVDLMIRRDRPFSREELARRSPVHVLGTDVHVASAEDAIISKLERAGRGSSERQLRDVAAILESQGDDLDWSYLDRWVRALHLEVRWEEAQRLRRRDA